MLVWFCLDIKSMSAFGGQFSKRQWSVKKDRIMDLKRLMKQKLVCHLAFKNVLFFPPDFNVLICASCYLFIHISFFIFFFSLLPAPWMFSFKLMVVPKFWSVVGLEILSSGRWSKSIVHAKPANIHKNSDLSEC